jgi:hypothetical protein
MGSQDAAVAHQVDTLRRDGSLVARFNSGEEAVAWRAAIRRACRAAGLRIRTGLANADERIAWVYHVDHTLTEAGERAARRAMEAAYNGEPRVPFHQLVREEQRKMLRVVRDNEEPSDSELEIMRHWRGAAVGCENWVPPAAGACGSQVAGVSR